MEEKPNWLKEIEQKLREENKYKAQGFEFDRIIYLPDHDKEVIMEIYVKKLK